MTPPSQDDSDRTRAPDDPGFHEQGIPDPGHTHQDPGSRAYAGESGWDQGWEAGAEKHDDQTGAPGAGTEGTSGTRSARNEEDAREGRTHAPDNSAGQAARPTALFGGTREVTMEVVEKYFGEQKAKRRNNLMMLAMGGILIFLLLVLLPGQTPEGADDGTYQGAFYTLALEPGWRAASAGDLLLFAPDGETNARVAVFWLNESRIWAFDVEAASRETRRVLGTFDAKLGNVLWEEDPQEHGDRVARMSGGMEIPYVLEKGAIPGGGRVLLRLYLSRDHMIAVCAWNEAGRLTKSQQAVLNSFRLDTGMIQPDYLRRKQRWAGMEKGPVDMAERLRQARVLFEERLASRGNAWQAKESVMEVVDALAARREEDAGVMPELERVWNLAIFYAEWIQDRFREKRASLLSARHAGRHDLVEEIAMEIQEIIPEKTDPRWIWSRQMALEAREAAGSDGRGFL